MSRYIDADALREEWLYENGTFEPNDVLDSIDCQPTVDAVPVVRCRECKKKFARDEDYKGNILRYICLHGAHEPNFFCADGERKEGKENGN